VEARDTEMRKDLTADERRATPLGSHEGIRANEQIVTKKAPVAGSQVKLSKKREETLPPRKTTPQAVAKRTSVQQGSAAITTTADNLGKLGHIWMSDTNAINKVYGHYMPTLDKWIDINRRSHALGHEFEQRMAEIKDEYEKQPAKLKGTGPGTISDFIEDSTTQGEWGFKPGYHDNGVINAKLKARFDAMPKGAQDVIRAVFRFGFDQHNQMQAVMASTINAQFDPAIAEAEAAGNAAEQKELEADKKKALANLSRLYDTRDGVPYAPKQRQGMFAVVGSSDEYRAAKKAGDTARMNELRKDQNHYVVNFRDTAAGAEAMAHNLKTKFGEQGGTWFERGSDAGHAVVSEKEMSLYLTRMEKLIDNSADKDGAAAKAMSRLNRDLFLLNLSENSARKSELHRENIASKDPVTGKGLDMMQAFITHGRATANLIGSLSNNVEMQQTIAQVKSEVEALEGKDRTNAQRAFNEVVMRYAANLGVRPGRLVDKLTRAVSVQTLLSVPMYHLSNASQTVLITHPVLASMYGWGKTSVHIARAYRDFFNFTKHLSPLGRVDFAKAPADVRPMLKEMQDTDRLNAGYANEFGSWEVNGLGIVGSGWNKVDKFLRLFPQRVEVMNRTTAAIAAYRLAKQAGKSEAEALRSTGEIIDRTHGDYSGANSPTPFRVAGDFGKVTLQFRKFQMISGALAVTEMNRAMRGATFAEKRQGMAALGFLAAHTAAIGGIVGLPASEFFGQAIMGLMKLVDQDDKDKDKWDNWHHFLRGSLGAGGDDKHRNLWADFLYKGAPYALLNTDTSDRMGMGNIFALAPYSGMEQALDSQSKFYETVGKVALGPSGGVLGRMVNGWGYGVEHDDWSRFWEPVLPGILGNTLKATRLKTEGLTAKQGETLIKPEEIDWGEALAVALGATPRQLANQSEQASDVYDVKDHYKAMSTHLRNEFLKARAAGDAEGMAQARQDWRDMQAGQRENKVKTTPMSDLFAAIQNQRKRQHGVIGGVESDKSTRKFVRDMTEPDDAP
jgi:hypothetical protein